jgi:hypothetical protein
VTKQKPRRPSTSGTSTRSSSRSESAQRVGTEIPISFDDELPDVFTGDAGSLNALNKDLERDSNRDLNESQQTRLVPAAADVHGDSNSLRVVAFEDSSYVSSLQSAIGAAGHTVIAAGSGKDGQKRVLDALRASAIDVLIVALPGGESILDAALALEPRRPVVIASIAGNPHIAVQRATSAGADLIAMRPHDVSTIAPILFAAHRLTIERRVTVAARGAEQALRARLDELADPEPRGFLPVEMFQRVLELELRRAKRFDYALSIGLFSVEVPPPPPPPGIRGILRARAGNVVIHTVRDIDIATQLDHERFLVMLPYTDLKGATGLARRVIAAVSSGDPVVAAGRKYPPKVIAAVASANLSQPVSYAKLMKDIGRVLDGARREGAELAVQP